MNYRLIAAAAGMAAALAPATQSLAQTAAAKPAAAAAPAVTFAPAPAGICVFDFQRMGDTSLAGKAVGARMKVIGDQVRADLQTQEKGLQADANALQAARGTTDQSTFETKAAAIQVRNNALQRLEEQRSAEMEQTQQNALGLLLQAVEPSLRTVFQSMHCAVLFNRTSVLIWNPTTDITDEVVTSMNGRVTTLTFDRATLAQPPRQ
jgi:Skp family chaperone for outer membrane proteins